MDNGHTVPPAVLFTLNCFFFSFCSLFSLSLSLFVSHSLAPWSPPLSSETSIVLDCRWNHKPTNTDPFYVLPSFPCFFPALHCIIFFCAVVNVSVLFRFNLTMSQLCMNQTVRNLIMVSHTTQTELPLLPLNKCVHMCTCGFPTGIQTKLSSV